MRGRKYFALYPLYNLDESGESNVIIPSKNHITEFDLFNDFDYYGTFGNQNGQLISNTGIEAKAIAKDFVFEEGSAISITIAPYYTGGRIEGGLYLGVQDDVSSKIDAITGYNINVERVAGASYFDVKIHAFDYNEGKGKFLGTISQVRIEGDVSSVELTVLYKGGKIYVYANNNVTPCMEMVVGELKGTVGVRSLMTSQRFYDMVAWEE